MLDYLPWRDVSSWECSACGICCSRFRVNLRLKEQALISRKWGMDALEFDSSKGNFYLRRLPDGSCIFLARSPSGKSICLLHGTKYRPYSCKIWPFHVTLNSRNSRAAFDYGERRYYIFISKHCPNLRYGNPSPELEQALIEAIHIYLNPELNPSRLTCQLDLLEEPSPQWLRYAELPSRIYLGGKLELVGFP